MQKNLAELFEVKIPNIIRKSWKIESYNFDNPEYEMYGTIRSHGDLCRFAVKKIYNTNSKKKFYIDFFDPLNCRENDRLDIKTEIYDIFYRDKNNASKNSKKNRRR